MRYLLDTNIVSDSRRGAEPVQRWLDRQQVADLAISAMTIAELEIGVRRKERSDQLQGSLLRRWLEDVVKPSFNGRILAVDAAVAVDYARIQVPDAHPLTDALIAATANVHDLTLVTRNTKDMERTGARLLNPWLLEDEQS